MTRDFAQTRADVIKGRRKAEEMLEEALADYTEDVGEDATDDVAHDLIVATCFTILTERWPHAEDVAREFCRTQLGSIPFDLREHLGEKDWVQ